MRLLCWSNRRALENYTNLYCREDELSHSILRKRVVGSRRIWRFLRRQDESTHAEHESRSCSLPCLPTGEPRFRTMSKWARKARGSEASEPRLSIVNPLPFRWNREFCQLKQERKTSDASVDNLPVVLGLRKPSLFGKRLFCFSGGNP
jgi:hypothetical protein